MKQVAKKAGQNPIATFAWDFTIVLVTSKYWSPGEHLGAVEQREGRVVAVRLTARNAERV